MRGHPETWEESVIWESDTADDVRDLGDTVACEIYARKTIAVGNEYPLLSAFRLGRELQLTGFTDEDWK